MQDISTSTHQQESISTKLSPDLKSSSPKGSTKGRSRKSPSKKKSRNEKCKKCGSLLTIVFDGSEAQYPVFSCFSCGNKPKNEWEVWWKSYSKLHENKENWKNPKHRLSCFVGYFCVRYMEFYGHPYTFSVVSPIPFKSKEFTMSRRILAMFDGDAGRAANYLDWAFRFKVKTPSYPVNSIGFFASSAFVNEYKIAWQRAQVPRRSTPLPSSFVSWCHDNESDLFERRELSTWNDLNGLVTYVKCYGDDCPEGRALNRAIELKMMPENLEYKKLEE
jgi:hypothetical protein